MWKLALSCLCSLLAVVASNKNYTVTSEAELEIEVKNYNGNGDDLVGKVVVGLFGDSVPVSALNFKTFCDGFKRPNQPVLTYKKTTCHRLTRDMLLQCGDVLGQYGHGTISIYGPRFNDENFLISHTSGGIVTYANQGRDTNGSQFVFTLGPSRFFDKRHVAFGKVVRGYVYLAAINRMGPLPNSQTPKRTIKISDCQVKEVNKYELSDKDLRTDDLEGVVSY